MILFLSKLKYLHTLLDSNRIPTLSILGYCYVSRWPIEWLPRSPDPIHLSFCKDASDFRHLLI